MAIPYSMVRMLTECFKQVPTPCPPRLAGGQPPPSHHGDGDRPLPQQRSRPTSPCRSSYAQPKNCGSRLVRHKITRRTQNVSWLFFCYFHVSALNGSPRATRPLSSQADTHYLLSRASMCVRDIYPIRHSKYVDECCQAISAAAEYPTDTYVVHLTRLHGMADRISRSLTQDVWHGTPASGSAPLGACVKSLESELLQMRSSLLEGGRQNGKLDQSFRVSRLT